MKLFSKSLLFFIGVVFFQGTLTLFLITGIITRTNAVDARIELEKEAGVVYENYNSWVRSLWKTTIKIAEDEDIKSNIGAGYGLASEFNLEKRLEEILISSGMESIILRTPSGLYNYINPSGAVYFSLIDLNRLKSIKNHPYVELTEINRDIYLVGVLRLGGQELFLLKRIEKNFFMQLSMQERSVVFISSYSHNGSGNLKDGEIFREYINSSFMNVPYTEVYNLEVEKGSYSAAFQKIGTLRRPEGDEDLFLVLLMSNEPYLSILSKINKTVLYVSIIVGLITILLSFYFSGRITRPIRRLIGAMNGIRKGHYDIK
ncbi:MAG: hypothetical protein J7L71_00460, partial [Spirochaetaceae bacterium]|nr:hypothetical protein [Spirochaetaceae bacterium]